MAGGGGGWVQSHNHVNPNSAELSKVEVLLGVGFGLGQYL